MADHDGDRVFAAVPVRPLFQPVLSDEFVQPLVDARVEFIGSLGVGDPHVARRVPRPRIKIIELLEFVVCHAFRHPEIYLLQLRDLAVLALSVDRLERLLGPHKARRIDVGIVRDLGVDALVGV